MVKKLKRIFYIANLHFNNYSCSSRMPPFPAWAYEVLFVNKTLGVADPSGNRPVFSSANAPTTPKIADCQTPDASVETSAGSTPGR